MGASWRFTETAPLRLIIVSWFYGFGSSRQQCSPSYEHRHVAGCAMRIASRKGNALRSI